MSKIIYVVETGHLALRVLFCNLSLLFRFHPVFFSLGILVCLERRMKKILKRYLKHEKSRVRVAVDVQRNPSPEVRLAKYRVQPSF